MPQSTWAAANSTMGEKYGGAFLRQQSASPEAAGDMTSLTSAAPPAASGVSAAFDTSHGLVAVAGLAAISIGLMAFATTVRVGHAEAHVGVGKV